MDHTCQNQSNQLKKFSENIEKEIKRIESLGLEPVFYDGPEIHLAEEQIREWLSEIERIQADPTAIYEAIGRYIAVIGLESIDEEVDIKPEIWIRAAKSLKEEN